MPDIVEIVVRTIDESSGPNSNIVGSFTEINSALSIGREVIDAAGRAYDETVGKAMKYAEEVRDLAQISGQSAEETSRFIQVLDDWQISAQQAEAVTRFLTKNGLAPNLETLAQLSDQYLAINDVEERNKFILDNLGRSGLEWVNVLKQGGDALREQGGAISENLILNDEQLQQAEEMRLATDALNDSWDGLSMTLGTKVLPALSTNMDILNDAITIVDRNGVSWSNLGELLEGRVAKGLERQRDASEEAAQALKDHADALDGNAESAQRAQEEIGLVTETLQDELDLMRDFQGVADNYNDKLRDLYKEHEKLLEEKQSLINQGYSVEGEKIGEINAKLDENIEKQGETAEAAQKAIKTRIVAMMEEAMMADKEFSPKEMEALLTLETQWGLMSDSAAKGAQNVYNAVQEYMVTGDLDAFKSHVDDVGQSILDLPDRKTITLDLITTANGQEMTPEQLQDMLEHIGG